VREQQHIGKSLNRCAPIKAFVGGKSKSRSEPFRVISRVNLCIRRCADCVVRLPTNIWVM